MNYDYIHSLQSAARRERAHELHCLVRRMANWMRSLVSGDAHLRAKACC
jgi:hypothetical protein